MPCPLIFALVFCGGFLSSAGAQTRSDISYGVRLFERTVETRVPDQPEIHLILRLPEGHTAEHPTAKGVLAFCTWQDDEDLLRAALVNDLNPLVRYAQEHGLALLTWNTATLWRTGKSYDQIKRRQWRAQDDDFDQMARAWERGVAKLCKEFALPEDGFLLYGFSRGAHWGGRLALRVPERFLAVHIHVANSYDKPRASAAEPLWMVTSGDLDRGRDNAEAFYRECQDDSFAMVFKVFNGLGHAEHPDEIKLRQAFFNYALETKARAERTHSTAADVMRKDLATSGLTGDVLSQQVYRGAEAAKIPVGQRVALPTEGFAEAWAGGRK